MKSKTDGSSDLLVTGVNEIVNKLKEFAVINSLIIATTGALLTDCKASKTYKKYATHINTFHEFLKEINMPYTRAKQYMDIWKYFGEKLLSEECDTDKLIKALPIVKKGGDVEEWFIKAKTLTHQDFNNEVIMTKGHKHSAICNHEHTKEWKKCADCGTWIPGE
ncbi:MAG: hypothetical protein AMQ74_01977 [Candidatus Methanofastidiosum methylothiophilum]|uniref:Uncharacterized protein n=1 Tax=Candidatus Methanofastidiosum methylothiophilum TaxID=1705564 RepID=A0A150IHD2_9EURY|nr:MAG: hypothetical protein AMQ74_01977 [Candidatus Methanofastidiosum methylthiophilus]